MLIIKRHGNKEFDLDSSKVDIDPPIEMEAEDQGIVDTQSIYKVSKIKFKNERRFLDDYLSMEDAK